MFKEESVDLFNIPYLITLYEYFQIILHYFGNISYYILSGILAIITIGLYKQYIFDIKIIYHSLRNLLIGLTYLLLFVYPIASFVLIVSFIIYIITQTIGLIINKITKS